MAALRAEVVWSFGPECTGDPAGPRMRNDKASFKDALIVGAPGAPARSGVHRSKRMLRVTVRGAPGKSCSAPLLTQ